MPERAEDERVVWLEDELDLLRAALPVALWEDDDFDVVRCRLRGWGRFLPPPVLLLAAMGSCRP